MKIKEQGGENNVIGGARDTTRTPWEVGTLVHNGESAGIKMEMNTSFGKLYHDVIEY